MNQETGWYDNTSNLYPTYTEPTLYSIQLSYSDYWPRHEEYWTRYKFIIINADL
jgi:hypothetical protein